MKVNLYNPITKQARQVKVGFSWTVFFFGPFPALFRGDFKWFLIIWITNLFTVRFSNLIFIFIYNKLYINDLIAKGFQPGDSMSKNILLARGFMVPYADDDDNFDDLDF